MSIKSAKFRVVDTRVRPYAFVDEEGAKSVVFIVEGFVLEALSEGYWLAFAGRYGAHPFPDETQAKVYERGVRQLWGLHVDNQREDAA